MKKIYALILVLLFAGTTKVFATHIMGMDLSYTCTGNNTYTFTLNFYRDCAGINVAVKYLHLVSKSNNYNKLVKLTEVGSPQNISLVCPSDVNKTTCNGGTITGTQKWVFTTTVTLPYYAKDWVFYYDDYARNNAITNLVNPGSDGIRVVDSLDNSSGACVNSPIFTTLPTPYVCNLLQTHYNNGGYDPDGDSLSYQLTAPLDSFGNAVKYVSPFSYTNPLSLDSATFEFSPQSGQMTFTPSGQQVTVTAERVYAYNKAGKIIGYVTRDIEIVVLTCTDETPTASWYYNLTGCYASSSNIITGCVGHTLSFTVDGTNANTADSDYMTTDLGTIIPTAVFTTAPGQPNVTGTVIWTPTLADTGTHFFTLTVKDNYCPIFNQQIYTFGITITRGVHAKGAATICKGSSTQLIVTGGTSYVWTPSTGLSCSTCSNPIASPSLTTTYIVNGSTSPLVCKTADTVVVTVDTFQTHASPHLGAVCIGKSIQLTGSNGNSMTWAPATGLSCTACANPVATPTISTNYVLTASDNNRCVTHDTAKITVNSLPTVTASASKPLICFNSIDTLNASGANTYTWGPSTNLNSTSGTPITAGPTVTTTYTVTGTNINGCVNTGTVTVICNPQLTASITSKTNVLCYGSKTGSATVTPSGGKSPYSYSWSPSGGNTATANALVAGTYTVTATDASGCIAIGTVIITQPQAVLSASITSKTNVLCFGSSTGSATVTAKGGRSPYTYSWSPSGGSGATANALIAGTYTVTVTDSGSCTATASVIITQPQAILSASIISKTNVLCFGSSTGSATVTATGGRSPYTYLWNPRGGNAATANALSAGTYTVTVTDSGNCTTTATVVITQPQIILNASVISKTNVLCFGNNSGSATVTATGGRSPYTYSWSPTGGNVATANALVAGTYTVTVTDSGNCTSTAIAIITQPQAGVSASITSKTNVLCYGSSTGSATVTTMGGRSPYTYSWSPSGGSGATANALAAGTYTVTVTDSGNCSTTAVAIITQPQSILSASIASKTNVLCFGNNTGSATVTATGGRAPYTYSWSPSEGTGATANTLAAGTYTVTVTDSGNCTATANVIITQPQAVLSASITSKTNVLCFGNNTGSATVTAAGGRSPYTYSWSPNGGTGATANALAAGTYTVTITDSGNCTTIATAIITQPQAGMSGSITSKTNVLCFGGATGSATVTVTGGRNPYTYSWSPSGGNAVTAMALAAGTYIVTVTDSGNCTTADTAVITQPQAILSASITSKTNVLCYGSGTGSAAVTVTGGRSPYTYLWSPNGGAGATANALASGTYTVTITDSGNCTATATVIITQPQTILSASVTSKTNVLCFGNSTGSAAVTVTGGRSPYTYSWNTNPVQTGDTATALSAGTYTVTVTDSGNCTTTATVIITQPQAILSASITSKTNVLCNGNSTGSATVTVTGGRSPYTYSWSPTGGSLATANALTAGTYTVTVTDSGNCTTTATVVITQPQAGLSASITSQTNVSCFGGAGSVAVTASGGRRPYTYSWNTNPVQTTDTAVNLSAGTYIVIVTDSGGCTTTDTAVITQPVGALNASITSQSSVLCFGGNTGSAIVTAVVGTPPYTYSWNTNPVQASDTAKNLSAGMYTVVVTDSAKCTTSVMVLIKQPQSALNASVTSKINVLCNGNSTGSAIANVTGGTRPYLYSWNTSPIQTGDTANNLLAGTYMVTVTDSNNCITTASVTITQPQAVLSASVTSKTNVLCNGNATGTAIVTATGGRSPYTYSWNTTPVQTGDTATGLSAGTYTVTVTDSGVCTTTASVTITQPQAALSASVTSKTNVLCSGNATGTAIVTATGGRSPYTYSWNTTPVQTGDTATGLLSGTYTVTVTDSGNCTTTASVTITQPQVVLSALVTSKTNVLCNGNTTGTAIVTATGGRSPYTYSWNTTPVQTGDTATGLSAGTYTVTVTDSGNCTTTGSVTITQPQAALNASVTSKTNVLCNGNATGTAIVSVTGGRSPYNYSWNTIPVQAGDTATGLSAGTYTVTVTDSGSCTTAASVSITQPQSALGASITSQTNVSCFGGLGSATVTVTGGRVPYTYSWNTSPVQTGDTATSLAAGTYTVTVTDSGNCTTTASVTITQPLGALNASITAQTKVLCFGDNTGSAIVTATAGTPPYTYSWNTTPVQTGDTATGLSAGTYMVTVMDSAKCITTTSVTITQPQAALNASINSQVPVSCFGNNNGSAWVTVSGGTRPFTYLWNTTPVQTGDTAAGLSAGTYMVTITDSNNCTTTASVTITQPQAALNTSISLQTNVLCYGNSTGSATVTVTGGTKPYVYSWNVPPPGQSTATAVNLSAGTYTVNITDSNNCTTTATAIITQPQAALSTSATASSPTVCSSSPTTLSAATSGGTGKYVYNWSPGSATTDSVIVNPTATTTYTVTVTDSNRCTTTGSVTVNVNQLPSVTAMGQKIICNTTNDTLTASGAISYSWSPAGGIIGDTTGAVVIASPTAAVTYTVTGTDANGCLSTATATVNINQLPKVSLSGLNPTYCYNAAPVALIGFPPAVPPNGIYSGNGTYKNQGNLFNPDSAGVGGPYTITYTYINDTTGCKNSASLPVTILGAPIVTVSPDSPAVCSGIQVTLQAAGADSYSWSPSTGLSVTTGANVTSNTTNTIVYTVTGTDTDGCSSSVSTDVTVNALPDVIVTPVVPNICLGNSITLNASGGTTYTWSPSTGLSCVSCSSTVANPTGTTQYIVNVNNGRCSASDTITVGVFSTNVKAGPDQHILYGSTAQLTASGADFYVWTPGNSLSNDSISDPIASPTVTTTYTVTGTDSLGCPSTDTVVIYVSNPCESLMMPSGFTPSGATNRYFHVLNVGGVQLQEFKVFNRWGQMVYETNNINGAGWDGTFNGKEQPMGTYVYYAEILCQGTTVFVKGDVTLIR